MSVCSLLPAVLRVFVVFVLDSPRVVGKNPITVDYTTSATRTMPGAFDDEDSEEYFDLDELSLGICSLGIKDRSSDHF